MKEKMTVYITGIDELILDTIIETIGSLSIAECDLQEGDLFDIILNPENTEVTASGNYINIVRTDTKNICHISHNCFAEVHIC